MLNGLQQVRKEEKNEMVLLVIKVNLSNQMVEEVVSVLTLVLQVKIKSLRSVVEKKRSKVSKIGTNEEVVVVVVLVTTLLRSSCNPSIKNAANS